MLLARVFLWQILLWQVLGFATVDIPAAESLSFEKSTAEMTSERESGRYHVFEYAYVNRSNSEVTIGHIKTSCGCVEAIAKPSVIAPGGSGVIQVTFDGQGKSGDNTFRVEVEVGNDSYKLSGLMRLPPGPKFTPNFVYWRMSDGKIEDRVVSIELPKDWSQKIVGVKARHPEVFSVELRETAVGGLVVSISPKSVRAEINDFIEITTSRGDTYKMVASIIP